VDRFDTSLNKQHVLAAIQFALPLYGSWADRLRGDRKM
jgi:hypothetical protein